MLCQKPGGIFIFVIPLWFTEALPGPMVGGATLYAFLLIFIYGFILLADMRFQVAIDHSWRWALGLGVLALTVMIAIRYAGIEFAESSWQSILRDLLKYFTTWAWIIGMLGFGHTHLNRTNRFLPYLNAAAYPYYILHQTVIVITGYFVVRWNMAILPKFLIITIVATGVTLGLYELLRRWSVTRSLIGMKSMVVKQP